MDRTTLHNWDSFELTLGCVSPFNAALGDGAWPTLGTVSALLCVTPGFTNKTECIKLYVCLDQFHTYSDK